MYWIYIGSIGFFVISSGTVDFPHDGKLSEFPVDQLSLSST
jgi:hypothetical protein